MDILNGSKVLTEKRELSKRKDLINYAKLIATGNEHNAVVKLEQILKNAIRKFNNLKEQREYFFHNVFLCYKYSNILGGGHTLKSEFKNYVNLNFTIFESEQSCLIKNPQLKDLSLDELLLVFGYAKKITYYNKKMNITTSSSYKSITHDTGTSSKINLNNKSKVNSYVSKDSKAEEDIPEWKKKLQDMLKKQ